MKEIGGYIELDRYRGTEYHSEAVAVNSGRHALEYLIRAKKIKKLFIPYFLCASIRKQCKKCGCEYYHYHISQNLKPLFSQELKNGEYLYIVNYYGQLADDEIRQYKERYKNIIIDNAQDFFRKPILGVDTVYTCRKYFGVSDGGYVYTDTLLDEDLPMDMSYDRIHYILGRYEAGAGTFYKESSDNNKNFASEPLKQMSRLTQNLLRGIDYDYVKKRRTENFTYLHSELKTLNKLELTVPEGAFMYPLYIDNGAELKKKLIANNIFVPTLWGDVFEITEKGSLEYDLAENIVPLPVDQRYDIEDMKYILSFINIKEKNDGKLKG